MGQRVDVTYEQCYFRPYFRSINIRVLDLTLDYCAQCAEEECDGGGLTPSTGPGSTTGV